METEAKSCSSERLPKVFLIEESKAMNIYVNLINSELMPPKICEISSQNGFFYPIQGLLSFFFP